MTLIEWKSRVTRHWRYEHMPDAASWYQEFFITGNAAVSQGAEEVCYVGHEEYPCSVLDGTILLSSAYTFYLEDFEA